MRRRKTKTKRITFELILLTFIVFSAVIIAVVNVYVLTTSTAAETETTIITSTNTNKKVGVDERLLRILRRVGIYNTSSLSKSDLGNLPSWKETTARVGNNGPIILGIKANAKNTIWESEILKSADLLLPESSAVVRTTYTRYLIIIVFLQVIRNVKILLNGKSRGGRYVNKIEAKRTENSMP